ncbi:CinA family protein [Paeniglutamicibacter antarcticus]|uniref:CinA family protein n=1 Tax=Arthrobacter terrae TaxID=2935737 RepID=A0A931CMQ4_9MICC|nr:CinA family protein [Arthrobacter terrae]MBG0739305.1 CinA family protein [Arthrobacter terrae]
MIILDLPRIIADATAAGLSVATAESLTGGMVAAALVQVPGASAMLLGGVIAYQNSVKSSVLGVSAGLLESSGAVDPEVAREMALGACRITGARVGVATTGVAGPEPHGGKSVGSVYIGIALDGVAQAYEYHFAGVRSDVRQQACDEALSLLQQVVAQVREQNP